MAYLVLTAFYLIGALTRTWILVSFGMLGLCALNHFARLFEIVKIESIAREEAG